MARQVSYDVAVIGAGAAGLMAAAAAGARGRRVLLLEHTDAIGAKILISGGGRCNFTNLDIRPERFLSANPHFCKSALARYTQHDFIALVRRHGIAFYEKTLGQLFCEGAGGAKKIVAMLLAEAQAAGVTIETGRAIQSVRQNGGFILELNPGTVACQSLIIAAGGLSIPKLGATAFAYRLAQQFGLNVIAPRPGLVPLVLGAEEQAWAGALSGVSLPVGARCGAAAFREGLVFTHRGVSGPAVLQVSSYWREGAGVTLDFAPQGDLAAELIAAKAARPRLQLRTALAQRLPERLVHALLARGLEDGELGALKDKTLAEIAARLKAWPLSPVGTEGYAKAEVTLGGVDTAALSSRTMEAKTVPGLYFIGEAVDVTGWLGGYNFQWAWSSAVAAGEAA